MTVLRVLAFPLVAAVLIGLATLVPSDDTVARPPRTVAVTQSTYACPAGSVISVSAGQVAAGESRTATVLPSRAADDALGDPAAWQTDVVDGAGVVVQQQGRGSGAVGYFAGTAPKSGGGGLVVGSCPGVVDDAWLLGLGSGDQHFSTVILTNLADSTAVADLTLWGPKGRIDAVDADGIVVEPHSTRRIRLDDLAAGEPEIAVHVHRRRGSLAAVANDTSTATYRGTEPVTSSLTPRREQIVPGLVEGTSGRTLLLVNPGTVTARVDVQVVGSDSTFTPKGLDQVKVGAGRVRTVTMPKTAGGDVQALRVVSDQPVAAAVRMTPSVKDHAVAESAAPLTGPAVVPVSLGLDLAPPRLVLTAPEGAASVEIEAFDADMTSLGTKTVDVPGGTTTAVKASSDDAAYVVVTPRGSVSAAATYVDGDQVSSLALEAAPVSTRAPQVRPVG